MAAKEKEFVIEGDLTSRSFYVRIYASSAEEAEKIFWEDASMYTEPPNIRWCDNSSWKITGIFDSSKQ
tara:strand:- start:746 stop:949 length:204 start_codon:yes stop_codon:yes gene_type:complete